MKKSRLCWAAFACLSLLFNVVPTHAATLSGTDAVVKRQHDRYQLLTIEDVRKDGKILDSHIKKLLAIDENLRQISDAINTLSNTAKISFYYDLEKDEGCMSPPDPGYLSNLRLLITIAPTNNYLSVMKELFNRIYKYLEEECTPGISEAREKHAQIINEATNSMSLLIAKKKVLLDQINDIVYEADFVFFDRVCGRPKDSEVEVVMLAQKTRYFILRSRLEAVRGIRKYFSPKISVTSLSDRQR